MYNYFNIKEGGKIMLERIQGIRINQGSFTYPGYPGMVPGDKQKVFFTGRNYPKFPVAKGGKTQGKLNILA